MKQQLDYTGMTIKIECYPGKLNEVDIQTIFNQYPSLSKIELVDYESKNIHQSFSSHFEGVHHLNDGFSITPFLNFPFSETQTLQKDSSRHQKCKSLSESQNSDFDLNNKNKIHYKNQHKKKSRIGSNINSNSQ